MKPSPIDMLRPCLLVVSIAATAIDAAALLVIGLFGDSEDVFTSTTFRAAAVVAIACMVRVTRRGVRAAFVSALSRHHASFKDEHANAISVSPACPVRMLVVLHLRFAQSNRVSQVLAVASSKLMFVSPVEFVGEQ
jgi:hypothetical protein